MLPLLTGHLALTIVINTVLDIENKYLNQKVIYLWCGGEDEDLTQAE